MSPNKKNLKRALVTGATGFVGSHLVWALIEDGWTVDIIVRKGSNLVGLKNNNIKVHVFDGEYDTMLTIVRSASPDVVFHIASMVVGEHKGHQLKAIIDSNILLGSLLLEAMVEVGSKCFINTGTYWEHYQGKVYSPVNLYAATKYAFQNLIQYYVEAKNIKSITLKVLDPYGENDQRPKLLNLLFEIAGTDKELLMTLGEQQIDLIHIDDLVNAYLVASKRLMDDRVNEHEVYEVSTGAPITLKKLVTMVEEVTQKKINIVWGGKPYRDREVMELSPYFSLLPNWQAKISLKQGLKDIQLMVSKGVK